MVTILTWPCWAQAGGSEFLAEQSGPAVLCGDGVRTGSEECDDGNAFDDDCCSADCLFEGGDICGDGVLMYQSDYPHSECEFPDSVKVVLDWAPTLGEPAMQKLMGGNAERFLRLL